MVNTF